MIQFLIAVMFLAGCSSLADINTPPPALENRTLRLSAKVPGFEYQYNQCVQAGLFGACRKWQMVVETYDLSDVSVRNKLSDMGFVARVRDKIVPMNEKEKK